MQSATAQAISSAVKSWNRYEKEQRELEAEKYRRDDKQSAAKKMQDLSRFYLSLLLLPKA
jgi:hypothetical protein